MNEWTDGWMGGWRNEIIPALSFHSSEKQTKGTKTRKAETTSFQAAVICPTLN